MNRQKPMNCQPMNQPLLRLRRDDLRAG